MDVHNILLVDDEPGNLNALDRAFKCDYNVFSVTNGEDALAIMGETEIALVITDHRMPGMTGIEFLEKAQQKSPDTIRIILTAYTDEKLLMAAINAGHVYGYVDKPWDVKEIRAIVKRGIETYEVTSASREPCTRALLHSGIISSEQLETALRVQQAEEKSIGEVLVQHGMISKNQLDMATEIQESKRKQLDKALLDIGAVSHEELEIGEALRKREKRRLAEVLVDLGYADEESIYSCYALHLGMPQISSSQLINKPELAEILPSKLAYKHNIAPMDLVGRILVVAALEPLSDKAKKEIEAETGYKVMAVYTSHLQDHERFVPNSDKT